MAAALTERLEATSNDLLEDLSQLADLEARKRLAQPGSATFVDLAEQVKSIATRIFGLSERQEDLAVEAKSVPPAISTQLRPVEETRPPSVVLAEWREAERRFGAAKAGSPEAEAARAEADRLRDEYQQAFRARMDR